MKKEIGSEFWYPDLQESESIIIPNSHRFLLSGRTAIDHIIKDIKSKKKIQSVYLPAYCCHTMIKPFVDNGIKVSYYQVNFKNGLFHYDIDLDNSCDIFFGMKYFGFQNTEMDEYIDIFKKNGVFIIEDATHSWFSENNYNLKSDYVFVSFRKWTGLSAGSLIIKNQDNFFIPYPEKSHETYIEQREKAYSLKTHYISQNCTHSDTLIDQSQKSYLKVFKDAEDLLENDYQNYCLTENLISSIKRINASFIKKRRQENAKYIIDKLSTIDQINLPVINDTDVPLFVPIFLNSNKRDLLYRYLINNNIFCPIHWPKPKFKFEQDNKLYNTELSLVCDQRYDVSDLNLLLQKIIEFFNY